MLRRIALPLFAFTAAAPCTAQDAPPLISEDASSAISSTISGSAAKRTVQALSMHHRMRGSRPYAAAAEIIREGDKRALQAKVGGFSEGSDHQVWAGGSWRIPVIYVADWPDRYIHTQRDVPANLDATKLKRAMFIAAAAGWYLANVEEGQVPALERAMRSEMLERRAALLRDAAVEPSMAEAYLAGAEADDAASLSRFGLTTSLPKNHIVRSEVAAQGPAAMRYRRKDRPKGPMEGFGYSWFDERLKAAGLPRPALLDRVGLHDSASFAYEALNLVDANRTAQTIRDRLAVSIGPVPLLEVADYLATLEKIGLLDRV